MRIDAKYDSLAFASPSSYNHSHHYVLVDTYKDKPVIVSTNGFALSVVPVELDKSDVLGPIHFTVFKGMPKIMPKDSSYGLKLGETEIEFSNGWKAPRTDYFMSLAEYRQSVEKENYTLWPNWKRTLVDAFPEPGNELKISLTMGLDAQLIAKASKALGEHQIAFTQNGPGKPVVATPATARGDTPPFALIMPLHVSSTIETFSITLGGKK